MINFTDHERVRIAQQEYKEWKVNQQVTINNGQTIGYVSKVINDKKTGEQAYIITDGNPKVQKPEEVKQVTVLYQGSMGFDKVLENPGEVKRDWWENNKELAENVLDGLEDPTTVFEPTKQMKSSAKTLNKAMDKYSNATFEVYGHSQASTNGQYAVCALDSQEKIDRIQGAYLYQGPNAYSMLNEKQRKNAAQLKERIFNFVDEKDLVPIGYRLSFGQVNPCHVGTLIFVDSKEQSLLDQHMWGGYEFVDGNLQVTKESLQAFQTAKHKYNEKSINQQLKNLDQLQKD